MVEFTTDWFANELSDLEEALAPFVGRPNLEMLEIGAYEGRSTLWFLTTILVGNDCRLTTIDTWRGSAEHDKASMEAVYDRFRRNTAAHIHEGKLTVLLGQSQPNLAVAIAAQLHGGNGPRFDIIFVDGSHTAADVLTDAVFSWTLLKPGGMLILDDYLWKDIPDEINRPKLAIDCFLRCFVGQFDIIHHGYRVVIRKREQVG